MATAATAQSFDPRTAGADLRKEQVSSQRSRKGMMSQIADRATKNVRGAMLAVSLMGDSPFSRGAELEDVSGGDRVEESGGGGGYTGGLSDQAKFAEEQRRYQILNATRRDIMPEYRDEEAQIAEEEEIIAQEQAYVTEQSQNLDVEQLGPTRGIRQQLTDQALELAKGKAKEKAKQLYARYAGQGVDDVIETAVESTELVVGEEDLGFMAWVGTFYDGARVAETILDRSGDDAGEAQKAVRMVIPPYKFMGDWGLNDIIDDGKLVIQLFLPALAIAAISFLIIILCIMTYGAAYFGGFVTGFPSF